MAEAVRIGVISDTHGKLPSAAVEAFRDAKVERIVHAGDIGSPDILRELEAVAPVVAVRGNNDYQGWATHLKLLANLTVGGLCIRVAHTRATALGKGHPAHSGVDVVVFGHTHIPCANIDKDGVFYLNPGSASRGRQGHSQSVAILEVDAAGTPSVRFVAV